MATDGLVTDNTAPTLAQLEERETVMGKPIILRSPVRARQVGLFLSASHLEDQADHVQMSGSVVVHGDHRTRDGIPWFEFWVLHLGAQFHSYITTYNEEYPRFAGMLMLRAIPKIPE